MYMKKRTGQTKVSPKVQMMPKTVGVQAEILFSNSNQMNHLL